MAKESLGVTWDFYKGAGAARFVYSFSVFIVFRCVGKEMTVTAHDRHSLLLISFLIAHHHHFRVPLGNHPKSHQATTLQGTAGR